MNKNNNPSSEGLIVRKVCSLYDLGNTTLRDWMKYGACGDPSKIPVECIGGIDTQVLLPEHVEWLDRFLLFRRLTALRKETAVKVKLDEALELQKDIEQGKLQSGICALEELMGILNDTLERAKLHYQSLHAKLHGDAPIDPLNDDLDE